MPTDRHRISLDVEKEDKTLLSKLTALGLGPSDKETICRSLRIADLIMENQKKGGRMILRDANGVETVHLILI